MNDQLADEAPPSPKRSTGPRSIVGKDSSSRNALTHGATSRRLINEDEHRTYEAWVQELSEAYPSKNPLVKMQIQRIAHLKVQLDRVQTAIAGLHEIERLRLDKYERAAQLINLSREERSDVTFLRSTQALSVQTANFDRLDSTTSFYEELLYLGDLDTIATREDFETRAPLFCEYIKKSAQESEQDIDEFIKSRRIVESGPDGAKKDQPVSLIRIQLVGPSDKPETKSEISDVPLKDLIAAAKFYRVKHWDQLTQGERLANVKRVAEIVQQVALPDLDNMDRLMRYQTSISRQISTAVGELLAIAKVR